MKAFNAGELIGGLAALNLALVNGLVVSGAVEKEMLRDALQATLDSIPSKERENAYPVLLAKLIGFLNLPPNAPIGSMTLQ